jgi:ATP-binding protein involved in chromosome partitioning
MDWGKLDYLLVDLPPGAERIVQYAELLGPTALFVLVAIPSDMARGVVARSIDALAKTPNQILGYVENMDGYYCSDCERVKPLFPAQPQVKLDLPCLGSVPFDPELAALCDRGGAPSDSHALFSWQPVRRIALEICQRVSERASAPEERA